MADDQHRLALVIGEPGHDRVVVGEPAVAVDLDEVREEALHEVLEPRSVRMPRDLHPLPRSERSVQLGPHGFDPSPERGNLAIAGVGVRQELERFDFLQQDGDRLFEFECLKRH